MAETLVEMAKRLCETEGHMGCYGCVMKDIYKSNECIAPSIRNVEEQRIFIENWANANPPKTYKDVLLEKFPDAEMGDDGEPMACRKHLFKTTCTSLRLPNPYKVDCQRCWNEPYKEDAHEDQA